MVNNRRLEQIIKQRTVWAMTLLFYHENTTTTTSTTHTVHSLSLSLCLSLSAICKQRNKHRGQLTHTHTHTHTHTGSESLTQTCKVMLIKGTLWLWWCRIRFPLTFLCTFAWITSSGWLNPNKKITKKKQKKRKTSSCFGSCLIPDGEVAWWKNAAGAFGQDGEGKTLRSRVCRSCQWADALLEVLSCDWDTTKTARYSE